MTQRIHVGYREECPFFSYNIVNGDPWPECGYRHWLRRRAQTDCVDCFGTDSPDCPFSDERKEEILVGYKINLYRVIFTPIRGAEGSRELEVGAVYGDDAKEYAKIYMLETGQEGFMKGCQIQLDRVGWADREGIIATNYLILGAIDDEEDNYSM